MGVAEMVNSGWVKLHRKFLDWEWYGDYKVVALFIHCLLKANHKSKNWRGNEIPRGTFITSYESLSKETGLSIREVRTAFSKLEQTGEIDKRATSLNSWVTVTNYDDYQDCDKPKTNERQASDKRATTTKNEKNDKNEKNIIFEDFWNAYSHKVGSKKKAEYYWNALKDKERDYIMNHLSAYVSKFNDKKFQPYPTTFLNQRYFEAEDFQTTKKTMAEFI
jgi:DNA-binding transcriptional MerR regulator